MLEKRRVFECLLRCTWHFIEVVLDVDEMVAW